MKPKQTAAERLFARYKTHDGPAGSPADWAAAAAQMAALLRGENPADNLAALGLSQRPGSLAELKQARRTAMRKAHPDAGGSEAEAQRINQAYQDLVATLPKPRRTPSVASPATATIKLPRCTAPIPADYEDGLWVGELKLDGSRYALYLGGDPYQRGHINTLLSRHESKHFPGQFVDKSDHAPHLTAREWPEHAGTILDGEIFLTDHTTTQTIMSSGPLEAQDLQNKIGRLGYHAIDIVFYKGQDLRRRPYAERRAMLERVVAELGCPEIRAVEQRRTNLRAFFDEVVEAHGEGIVLKRLDAAYGDGWAKLKKSYDVSCIISGFKPGKKGLTGMVGSLKLSVFGPGGELTEIGFASGFDNALRERITAAPENYLGRVVDVFAHELTVHGRLRHATFHRFRDDVEAKDCTTEKVARDLRQGVTAKRSKK
jgi:ATP-dependent DNA ligase